MSPRPMLKAAERSPRVGKQEYDARLPDLRARLLDAHRRIREAKVPVLVVIAGADGAGKGETVNRLHEWLDPRGLETHAFGPPTDEERERPAYWRFWRTLPARGHVGIYFGSWYTEPILERVYRQIRGRELAQALDRVAHFEKMLAEDGALIVKVWLHLAKKAQRHRLASLESDPRTRWRVAPLDWSHFRHYDRFVKVSARALRRTDAAHARWFVVGARDDRARELAVGQILLEQMEGALRAREAGARRARPTRVEAAPRPRARRRGVLRRVDLGRTISARVYDERLPQLQGRLNRLVRVAGEQRVSSVLVFEGWDAAGKGGCIRRLAEAMDARAYRVIPIAAPTDEERAHHYLWRFWRHLPPAGRVTIYDRSWYGRVLVERVEGFATETEWRRAYQEINDFEEQLAEAGIVLCKFWLHLAPEEQLRRFEERQATSYKRHKITDEDWRNRDRWPAYEAAVDEMVARTGTGQAPWTLVPANDKRHARVQVLETVCARLEAAL